MFLAPVAAKAETRLAEGAKVVSRQLENAGNFLRRDGLNTVEKAEKTVESKVSYFAPTTPIFETVAPKDCGNAIDFRF